VGIDELIPKLVRRVEVTLEYGGAKVLDSTIAELLRLIDSHGSILAASKSLGISYSRAWEWISRAELVLGVKLIEKRRGGSSGGGAKLTDDGKALLNYYDSLVRGLRVRPGTTRSAEHTYPELVIAGSHDPLLEVLAGLLRRDHGVNVEVSWIGSCGGLASLMLGEADIAGTHLYDPTSDTYNVPYLKNYWLEDRVVVVRGYQREVVFALHAALSLSDVDEVIKALTRGELRLVNRNVGSGTRALLDHLISRYCGERGLNFREVVRGVKGYEYEVNTHLEVVKSIAEGRADVGLTLRYAANLYNLRVLHVRWEWYDFIILKNRLSKAGVATFLNKLRSEQFREIARNFIGYRIPPDMGSQLYGRDT